MEGRIDDVVEEMLALEEKNPPIFVVTLKGVAIGVAWFEDGDEEVELIQLVAGLAVVSTFHSLRAPTGADASLESGFAAVSVFHILNAPHPVAGFVVSASCPVVMVGIGGSLTDSGSATDDWVSAMKSRSAFAHVSDASRASLTSDNSCFVSSNSALAACSSRRSVSISPTRGSLAGKSKDSGGDVRPKRPEKRFEPTRWLLGDVDKSAALSACPFGLLLSNVPRDDNKKPESEMDEMRL